MKKLRSILSLAMVMTMMISMSSVSMAASTAPEKLNDMGLLLNISDSELDSVLSREVGLTMILKSLGYTQEDADKAASNGYFTDVPGWSKGWAELAYTAGITTGIGNNKFNPTGALTEKQFVAFQLRALEYDTAAAWNDADLLAKAAGLIGVNEDLNATTYTKRLASDVMYNALSSKLQKEQVTLIKKLVDDEVVASVTAEKYELLDTEVVEPPVVDDGTFKVAEISHDNLKVLTITFTQPIDEDTIDGDTIEVNLDGDDLSYDSTYSDGVSSSKYALNIVNSKTVDIVLGSAGSQSDEVIVELDNVKSDDGDKIEDETIEVTLKDIIDPFIVDVEATNPKTIVVEFNEPVQISVGSKLYDDIYLDELRLAATGTLSPDGKVATFELNEQMDSGSHKLMVESQTDYANFVSKEATFTFSVVSDNDAPEVVSAEAINKDELVIVFDELIEETQGYIEVSGNVYKLSDSDVTVDEKTVTVELDESLTAAAAFTDVEGIYKGIEDLIGNEVEDEETFTFRADFDDKAPTMDVEVNSSNQIIVTFSEAVQSFTKSNVSIEDENEDDIAIDTVESDDGSKKVFIITLDDAQVDSVEYTLKVEDVKDLSVIQNTMADKEVSVQLDDKLQPEVVSVLLIDEDKVRVTFSEAMDDDHLEDGDFYMYMDDSEDTTELLSNVSGYDIDAASDDKSVVLEIPGVSLNDTIRILHLQDLSGSILKEYNEVLDIEEPAGFDVMDLKAELIEDRKIKLTATDHEFEVIFASDFLVRDGSDVSDSHYVYKAEIDSTDKNIAYITLNADLDTDGKYDGKTQYIYTVDEPSTLDTYGQALEISKTAPLKIEDGLVPEMSIDLSEVDTLILVFTEEMSASSESKVYSDILLRTEGGTVIELLEGDNLEFVGGSEDYSGFEKIKITGLEGGETYALTVLSRYIQDDQENPVEEFVDNTVEIKD